MLLNSAATNYTSTNHSVHRSWVIFHAVFIRHFRLNFQSKYVLKNKQNSKSKLCILPKCLIQSNFILRVSSQEVYVKQHRISYGVGM
jgi:hypothetical protein